MATTDVTVPRLPQQGGAVHFRALSGGGRQMAPRSHPTARQMRLGAELRKLREAAGLRAREVAAFLDSTSGQMSQMEAGIGGVSAARVRRLAAHYSCADEAYVEALVAMTGDRTRGWWEECRGVLPPVFLDTAEVEHHATRLRAAVITHVPGLLQTAAYVRDLRVREPVYVREGVGTSGRTSDDAPRRHRRR